MPLIGSLEVLSNAVTGTNLGLQTLHGIAIGEGPGMPLNWVVLASGQLLMGNTGTDPTPANLVSGSGIMITTSPAPPGGTGTITIAATGGGGSSFSWNPVMAPGPVLLSPNAGYIPSGGGTVALVMPVASGLGDVIEIVGNGTMWTLATGGNTIHYISQTATTSLDSTTDYDAASLLCVDGSNTYVVKSSEGNLTVT